jgi:hypothetical protein
MQKVIDSTMTETVYVDQRGFLTIDGIPLCIVSIDGQLTIKDKDRRRAANRGSDIVVFTVESVETAIRRHLGENET